MATDFTPNYNLDKYVATDKPNLRDQYNAAMDKIDAALLSANTNATEAKAATQSFAGDIAAKADQTDLDALGAIIPDTDFSAQNTVKAALNSKASNTALNSLSQTVANQGLELVKMRRNIRNKKIVVIGDSLTYSSTGHATRYWWQYLSDFYSCQTFNFAVGGTGFTRSTPNFLTQLQNAANSSSFSNDSITDVIIMGGLNDFEANDTSLRSSALNAFIYARQTFSKAEIHFGPMLKGTNALGIIHSNSPQQLGILRSAAIEEGISLIEGPWTWLQGISIVDYGDGIHVTAGGQKLIAGYVASHLMGGSTLRVEQMIALTYDSTFQTYCDMTQTKAYGCIDGLEFSIRGVIILKDAATNPIGAGNKTVIPLTNTPFINSNPVFGTQTTLPLNIAQVVTIPSSGTPYTTPPRLYLTNNAIGGQQLHYIRYSGTSGNLPDSRFGFTGVPFGI